MISGAIELDGARYSGSGMIVRSAAGYAALVRRPLHVRNARLNRSPPGLRPQHVRAIEAIAECVGGTVEGATVGSLEYRLLPGVPPRERAFVWDIGSAGSTTLLALAVLPVLAFAEGASVAEIRGGVFQDFAPSAFHLEHVLLPLVRRMGLDAEIELRRPGYVPRGAGALALRVQPVAGTLRPLVMEQQAQPLRIWGVALASHLAGGRVAERMVEGALEVLRPAGHEAAIEIRNDDTAAQRGAALALFADLADGARLGADGAGAPGRRAEAIGRDAARRLLDDLASGATVDMHAADQIVAFAALAAGETRVRIPQLTDHVESAAWLAKTFLGASVRSVGGALIASGAGFHAAGPT